MSITLTGGIAPAYEPGRNASHYGKWRHIAGDNSPRPHHGAPADMHAGGYNTIRPNPDIIINNHAARSMALGHDGHIAPGETVIGGPDDSARADGNLAAKQNFAIIRPHVHIGRQRGKIANAQFSA